MILIITIRGIRVDRPRFKLAGWLSILSAIITFPTFTLLMSLENISDISSKITRLFLVFIDLSLFIYIYLSLKKLLNSQFRFHKVDVWIWMLIFISLMIFVFSLLSLVSNIIEKIFYIISLSLNIFFGIILIIFAIKILDLFHDLFGLLRPFSYTSVINGIVSVIIGLYHFAIILIPKNILNQIKLIFSGSTVFILVLIYLFTDILIKTFLGMVFFKAQKSFFEESF